MESKESINHHLPFTTYFSIFIMGASGLIGQILLLRELLIVFSGNELIIGIILANWLISGGLGAFISGKIIERKSPIKLYVLVQLIFVLALNLGLYSVRALKEIIGAIPGEGLDILTTIISSFLIILPVSTTHNALFTIGCGICNSVGKVYIYETLGTLIGAIIFTYLLILYFSSFDIVFGITILNLFINFVLLRGVNGFLGYLTRIFLILFVILAFFAEKINRASIAKQWLGQEVVHYENSIYANITVIKNEGQYTIFSNGCPIITTPIPDIAFVEEFVHIPMLIQQKPEEILIISGGAGGVINEILKHPIKNVDYVELDPLILKLLRKFPTSLANKELNSPLVSLHYQDGRAFLKKREKKYDVIFIGISNPSDLHSNRFFTKEFFALCKKRLRKDGILALHLPASLTYMGYELKKLNACMFRTFNSVFEFTRVVPGDGFAIYLGSSRNICSITGREIAKNLLARNLSLGFLTPSYIEYKFQPRQEGKFFALIKDEVSYTNSDFKPRLVYYSLMLAAGIFSPWTKWIFRSFEELNIFVLFLAALFLLWFFLSLRFQLKKTSIPLCILTSGFAGIIFQLFLVFSFQVFYGYIFHWLGLVVSFLMAGYAFGAWAAIAKTIKKPLSLFLKVDAFIIIYCLILPLLIKTNLYLISPAIFLIFAIISGFLVGFEFPLANSIYRNLTKETPTRTAGLLYGADLIGGFFGGIFGAVVLFPIMGFFDTLLVLLMLKLVSFIFLLVCKISIASF